MKRIQILFAALILAAGCSGNRAGSGPAPSSADKTSYTEQTGSAFAALSVINMREKPDFTAEMGTQALMGTPLKVYGNDGVWWLVETPDGYRAWTVGLALQFCTQADIDVWKASRRVIVTTHFTLFRKGASPSSDVLSDGVWGDIVRYAGCEGQYTEVILPKGDTAYVPSKDVEDLDTWAKARSDEASAERIISTAKQFLGFPYLWAGTSAKGFDCSGLTRTVYFLNGYQLLRNCSQQIKAGDDVDLSDGIGALQPGDLIFFGRRAEGDTPERPSHVGIYIGGGRFIHAAQVVRINSLVEGEPDYYDGTPRLLRGRRILGNMNGGKNVLPVFGSDVYFDSMGRE